MEEYEETQKEKMEWLKENDPITYYELTSNPTGSDGDDFTISFIGGIFTVLIIGLLI